MPSVRSKFLELLIPQEVPLGPGQGAAGNSIWDSVGTEPCNGRTRDVLGEPWLALDELQSTQGGSGDAQCCAPAQLRGPVLRQNL